MFTVAEILTALFTRALKPNRMAFRERSLAALDLIGRAIQAVESGCKRRQKRLPSSLPP